MLEGTWELLFIVTSFSTQSENGIVLSEQLTTSRGVARRKNSNRRPKPRLQRGKKADTCADSGNLAQREGSAPSNIAKKKTTVILSL